MWAFDFGNIILNWDNAVRESKEKRSNQIRDLALQYSIALQSGQQTGLAYRNVNEKAFHLAEEFYKYSDSIWMAQNELLDE